MPQQAAVAIENNFTAGLITEATGLNFPENSCTETFNCEFALDGSVNRRLGFDFEADYQFKSIDRANKAVTSYLWKNVSGNGDWTIFVLQVGLTIYFYEVIAGQGFSTGEVAGTVTLTPNSGAVKSEFFEVQFCDGNGLLFVTHPHCDPLKISYDTVTHIPSSSVITINIRDFEGAVIDPYTVSERPTATLAGLSDHHEYNLRNQGWTTENLTAWDTAQTTMPSNADVMWSFKDSAGDFDASTASINRKTAGNTPAPKGHFILTLWNQDRNANAGTTGVASPTTEYQRPSSSAFFAGRIFYSGLNYVNFNSKIYFSQIIESVSQYGNAYQVNDPTAESLFDLLSSDGGVISIPEAGTIHKLVSITGGLSVHAENGVWYITGSSGLGFTANDYTVQKISNNPTLSASSFVSVEGFPCWWNSKGIYLMKGGGGSIIADGNSGSVRTQQNMPTVTSITDQKIKSFFKNIPLSSKKYSKGIYHYLDNHIRWIYRSEATDDITKTYEYDRVLNLNLLTGAFYPWSITESNVKVNAIIPSDVVSGNISSINVIDGSGNNVIDGSGNNVVVFTSTGTETSPFDKYLVSYRDGSTDKFTFVDKINANYLDWASYDGEGESYESYFITGYKVRGQGIRKFQNNWVRIFSTTNEPVKYYFQGIWDYANTGSGTGRWSSKQFVEHNDTNYNYSSKRLKVRGHGLVLQFKVASVPREPFDIIGWSSLQVGNASP